MSNLNETNPLTPFPFNLTLYNDPKLCTFDICPESWAASKYRPSLPGNAFYASVFGLCLAVQVFLGVRHRTWGFMAGMVAGCILEITGYVGRILIHINQFDGNGFLIQITTLTIAPTCFAASIYLCLSRLVIVFGQNLSRFSPRTYTLFFVTCDVISLIIQAAGAVTTSMSDENENIQKAAVNVMVAGIAFQVVSLAVFLAACTEFGLRVRRAREEDLNTTFAHVRHSLWFRCLMWALATSTLAIFARSIFRCAELKDGFQGRLANNQVTFMVLEGAMVAGAVILMTAFHPGIVFHGEWSSAAWHLRKKTKKNKDEKEKESEDGQKLEMSLVA